MAEQEVVVTALDQALRRWPPGVSVTGSGEVLAHRRFGRWCIGMLVVVFAVSASLRSSGSSVSSLRPMRAALAESCCRLGRWCIGAARSRLRLPHARSFELAYG